MLGICNGQPSRVPAWQPFAPDACSETQQRKATPIRALKITRYLLVLATVAFVITACGEDDEVSSGTTTETVEITVTEEGIDPDGFRLLAPANYLLGVSNQSDTDCSFSLGSLVVNLDVPANSRQSVEFATVDTFSNDQVEVGCGDERSGSASVRGPGS